jgi:tRNA (guanine10-N2)-dimethyltransferase
MEIIFTLSKEHPTLPKAEVKSVLTAESIPFDMKQESNGVLIIEIPDEYLKSIETIGKRLSHVHEVCRILLKTDMQGLISKIKEYPWNEFITKDYVVRVKKMNKEDKFSTTGLEREIGGIINGMVSPGVSVNLEDPSTFLRLIFLNGKVFVCERLFKVAKKHFYDLKPHKRPFFYPGSMSPKLARCMVNLTRVKRGDKVLDPFCGTGGILIEAGLIGTDVVGSDMDSRMVQGTIKNLEYCGIKNHEIFQSDARRIKLPYRVDAIVTDPPYGISASTGGEKSETLYSQALIAMEDLIKDDGRICMATPHYMDIQNLVALTNFEIIEQYHIRMHRSLTRVVSVLEKKQKALKD